MALRDAVQQLRAVVRDDSAVGEMLNDLDKLLAQSGKRYDVDRVLFYVVAGVVGLHAEAADREADLLALQAEVGRLEARLSELEARVTPAD